MGKKVLKHINPAYIVLLLGVIIVCAFLGRAIYRQNKIKEFEELCQDLSDTVSKNFDSHFSGDSFVKSTECSFSSEIVQSEYHEFYNWNDKCQVKLNIDDEFDTYDPKKQIEMIHSYEYRIHTEVREEINKSFPDLDTLRDDYDYFRPFYDGNCVFYGGIEYDIELATSQNVYRPDYEDTFIKNGQEITVAEEKEKSEYSGSTGTTISKHKCESCGRDATHSIEGFNGTLEWYCDDCWKKMSDAFNIMMGAK